MAAAYDRQVQGFRGEASEPGIDRTMRMDEVYVLSLHQLAQTPTGPHIHRPTHGHRSNAQAPALGLTLQLRTRLTGDEDMEAAFGERRGFAEDADFLPAPAR